MKSIYQPNPHFPILSILTFTPLVTSLCYYHDGTIASNPIYQPCISIKDTIGMCCASNRSNPAGGSSTNGVPSDECLANGLCMNVLTYRNSAGEPGTNTTYWRNQCMISDWTNNGCLNVCTKGSVCFWFESQFILKGTWIMNECFSLWWADNWDLLDTKWWIGLFCEDDILRWHCELDDLVLRG